MNAEFFLYLHVGPPCRLDRTVDIVCSEDETWCTAAPAL